MLKVYNTKTKSKEEFNPLKDNEVTMYVCGPTVYNDIHIGNARSMVAFDTIRRYLEMQNYEVTYVSNFTDVDDKIINKAKELQISPREVADKYILSVKEDMAALNIKPATKNPLATDYIEQMIAMITKLIDKGYAYPTSNGDVYFKTRSFSKYGQLSNQKLDELEAGASNRVILDENVKQDLLDFALWKHSLPGEIAWETPFGKGRPGWHIECSAMATEILGDTIDIHGGGQDLIFPHHENELAQSECCTGHTFANYWLHNGYVTVGEQGEKMSKSLGNFTTVKDLVAEVGADVVRFFMATAHYRKPLQFSEANIQEAKVNLAKIKEAYEYLSFRLKNSDAVAIVDIELNAEIEAFMGKFKQMMDDDFNTANAISIVYDFVRWINEVIRTKQVSKEQLQLMQETLTAMMKIFGIEFCEVETENDAWIEAQIAKRNQARANKDYSLSDQIRDELKEKGIILEDTASGTRYKRV